MYGLAQHAFYPLRIEEYGRDGNLIFIQTRIAEMRNPNLKERGYGMMIDLYGNVATDLLTDSVHDTHQLWRWTEEDRRSFFNLDFLRRGWFIGGVKSKSDIACPEAFFLRPALHENKFPGKRQIKLPSALPARIDAQEQAERLVFSQEQTEQ